MILKPCPHCGDQPVFSGLYDPDDRRYMAMDIRCCTTMTDSIGYPAYTKVSEKELVATLQAMLAKEWNRRHREPGELTADQLATLVGRWDGVYVDGVDAAFDIGKKLREQIAKILENP